MLRAQEGKASRDQGGQTRSRSYRVILGEGLLEADELLWCLYCVSVLCYLCILIIFPYCPYLCTGTCCLGETIPREVPNEQR